MPQAIERMSEDAKVILLLCGHLARTSGVKPLSLGEYNQVARALRESDLRPADLLKPKNVPFTSEAARIDPERLAKLLERGMQRIRHRLRQAMPIAQMDRYYESAHLPHIRRAHTCYLHIR